MQLDATRYHSFVEGFDLSDARKAELICIVWTMMQSFVDRAFGDAPEQICLGKSRERLTATAPDALGSGLILRVTYNQAAEGLPARKKRS